MTNHFIIILSGLFILNYSIYSQTNNDFKIKIKAAESQAINASNKINSTDTIEFIYLMAFKGYVFSKITEGKSNHFYKKGNGGFTRFFHKIDTSAHWILSTKNYNLKLNDTISDAWWFLQKYDASIIDQANFNHTFGKLLINVSSNIIKIQDIRNNVKPINNFGTLLFKVIKLSQYEIILEDLQNKEKHRRYYFLKNYS